VAAPGQSRRRRELAHFLDHRGVIGWVLLATMIFFSSLAFTVLENAMSVIFLHRVAIRRRHFWSRRSSLLLHPLSRLGLLLDDARLRLAPGDRRRKRRLSRADWSLRGFRACCSIASACRREFSCSPRSTSSCRWAPVAAHALSARIAAPCCGRSRATCCVWYFGTLSQVNVVYGSLTTAIVVLLSLEIAATLLLLGAQVIAEYERIGAPSAKAPPQPLQT
jgi:hypothetical protein